MEEEAIFEELIIEDETQMNVSHNYSSSCDIYKTTGYKKIAIIAASSGAFSMVASIAVIFIIVLFKKYNFFIQRLILYLCIATALNSAAIVLRFSQISNSEDETLHRLCMATAFIDQTTLWSLTIAFCCMTLNMLIVVIFNKSTKSLEMGYICGIFMLPLMYNWIPFMNETYGEAGPWCWIRNRDYNNDCSEDTLGIILQYGLWYIPNYVILVLTLIVYIVIVINVIRKSYHWRGLYSTEIETQKQRMKELVMPIIFYPVVFFILALPPLINRIYNTLNDPNYILWLLHAILSPLRGGLIALVYVLDKDTLRRLNFKELHSYLFHRRTAISEYPVQKGFTDSYADCSFSPEGSTSSFEEVKILVNKGERERKYGSNESNYVIEKEQGPLVKNEEKV